MSFFIPNFQGLILVKNSSIYQVGKLGAIFLWIVAKAIYVVKQACGHDMILWVHLISSLCTLNIVISKIILIRISWKLLLSNLTDVKVNTYRARIAATLIKKYFSLKIVYILGILPWFWVHARKYAAQQHAQWVKKFSIFVNKIIAYLTYNVLIQTYYIFPKLFQEAKFYSNNILIVCSRLVWFLVV